MKKKWMGLTLGEIIRVMEDSFRSDNKALYEEMFEGFNIVRQPEFEFSMCDNGDMKKYFNLTKEEIKLRRIYFRNRQNGRKRMGVPMQQIIVALRDHDAAMAMYEEKKKTRWESMLTNEAKLFLLDPENQEF